MSFFKNLFKSKNEKKALQTPQTPPNNDIIITHEIAIQYLKDKDCDDEFHRALVLNAVDAVNKLQLWHWVKTFEPSQGFMFGSDPNIEKLYIETDAVGHSAITFAFTIRFIQEMSNKFVKDKEHILCSICLLDAEEDTGRKVTLECYHSFHKDCISRVQGDCPLCRGKTIPESLRAHV
jgi:hypothetical protein